jgi:hypothetical protein
MDFVIISHVGMGKALSHLPIYYMSVMLLPHLDISLGSGKLDPEVLRKTHSRSILAFSKDVG